MEEATRKTQTSLPDGWETENFLCVYLQLWLKIVKEFAMYEGKWTERTRLVGISRFDGSIAGHGDSTLRILGINPDNGLPYNAQDEFFVDINPQTESSWSPSKNANVYVRRGPADKLRFEIDTSPMVIDGIVNAMRAGGSLEIRAIIEFVSVPVDFLKDFENAIYICTESISDTGSDWGFVERGRYKPLCVAKCAEIRVVEHHADMDKDLSFYSV